MEILPPMGISDISEEMRDKLIENPNWGMERKRDGRFLKVKLPLESDGTLLALGKSMKPQVLPEAIQSALESFKISSAVYNKQFVLNGELVWICKEGKDHRTQAQAGKGAKPCYAIWDIEIEDQDKDDYVTRKRNLIELVTANGWHGLESPIQFEGTLVKEESKRQLLTQGELQGWEGYVFKDLTKPYISGGVGLMYRWKYHITRDYIVIGYTKSDKAKNPFRALAMAMYDAKGKLIPKGQCGGGFPDNSEDTEKPTRSQIFDKLLKNKPYWLTSSRTKRIRPAGRKRYNLKHKFNDKNYNKSYGTIHWLEPQDWFVIEVTSQKLTEYGIPYMAQFQRLREDKLVKDCVDR